MINSRNSSAIIARADLGLALAAVLPIVEKRTRRPVLLGARLHADGDDVIVSTTDLDITASYRIPGVAADADFRAVIPAHNLSDMTKKAPATTHVAIDSSEVTQEITVYEGGEPRPGTKTTATAALDFEGLRIDLNGYPVADWPEMKIEGEIHVDFEMPTQTLLAALQAVEMAISKEETRSYLNGVFMHVITPWNGNGRTFLRFVATDGHRMAVHDVPAPDGATEAMPGIIIPRATVAYLIKLAKAKAAPETTRVLVNTVKARFTLGRVDVLTKLVDGTYPDYGRVMPSANDKTLTVGRKALIEAVEAVTVVQSERGRAVKLTLADDALTLVSNNPGMGSATQTLAVSYSDDPLEIGFNAKYMLDIAKAIDSETVTFMLRDPGSPTLIYADAEAPTRYVLMPMRV